MDIGLSLIATYHAAAWYFLFVVCHFFARPGEKMTHEELNIIGKRKSQDSRSYQFYISGKW